MKRYHILIAFLVFLMNTAHGQTIIYVDDDANSSNADGRSWSTAYKYLQDVLQEGEPWPPKVDPPDPNGGIVRTVITALSDLDVNSVVEIRVAQGTYTPDQGARQTPGDRTASFHLKSGISLKGSYAGLGMPDPNARDIKLYETILSGDLAGNDVEVNDPCDLEDEPSRAENSYHVVYMENADETTLLQGVTITGGYAWTIGGPGPDAPGARYSGGGLRCVMSDDPTIAKCTFRENFAERGGGMSNSSNAKIIECAFIMNAASAIGGEGGGLLSGGKLIIEKCKFIGNWASGGGSMAGARISEATINDCVFIENGAAGGGAGIFTGGSDTFSNCIFERNSAQGGGALRNVGNRLVLINCLFSSNMAEIRGGAIDNNANRSLVIDNCSFVNNASPNGNAMSFWANVASNPNAPVAKNVQLTNCILWNGDNEIWQNDTSTISVSYSTIWGGYNGVGNTDDDPLFADPNNGDYHLKSQGGRWEPKSRTWIIDNVTSPCIDTGDPNSPIGLEPFPNGGRINMGVYGGTAEASKSYFDVPPCETIIAGDINGDCRVDFNDIAILVSHWLKEG